MAYLAFDDTGLAPVETRDSIWTTLVKFEDADEPRLSALEWSVVALARRDTLASLRTPGRVATALRAVFKQPNPMLADERLEALRRIAVLGWHYGYTIPTRELRAFLAAGFTPDQYDLMMASIGTARARMDARR